MADSRINLESELRISLDSAEPPLPATRREAVLTIIDDEVGEGGAEPWQTVDLKSNAGLKGLDKVRFRDVVASRERFVAVGNEGRLATSEDGVVWTDRTDAIENDLASFNKVVWSGGHFLALTSEDEGYLSTDGIDWTRLQFPFNRYWTEGVIRGEEILVMAKSGSVILSKDRGLTWETGNFPFPDLLGLAYSGNIYVAVSNSRTFKNRLTTSRDGLTWEASVFNRDISGTPDFYDVTWTGSELIAVGDQQSWGSEDGETWKWKSQSSLFRPTDVSSNEHQIIASRYGRIFISRDGYTWSSKGNSRAPKKLTALGTLIVGVNGSGDLVRSEDLGSNWLTVEHPEIHSASRYWTSLYSGDRFLVAGDEGEIWTSPDGLTWTQEKTPVSERLLDSVWADSRYVVVGSRGTILTSEEGTDWQAVDSGTNYWLRAVAWTGKFYVAVGNGGTILKSSNGVRWSQVAKSLADEKWTDVVWTGEEIVVVGDEGAMATGNAGLSKWSLTRAERSFQAVEWDGESLYAIDAGGDLLRSADGEDWEAELTKPEETEDADWGQPFNLVRDENLGVVAMGRNGALYYREEEGLWRASESRLEGKNLLYTAVQGGEHLLVTGTGARVHRHQNPFRGFDLLRITPEVVGKESSGLVQITISTADGKPALADLKGGYQVLSDSAVEGVDFGLSSGVFTLAKGLTEMMITIPIINDDEVEPEEAFHVALYQPEGTTRYLEEASIARVRINSDDDIVEALNSPDPYGIGCGGWETVPLPHLGLTSMKKDLYDLVKSPDLYIAVGEGGTILRSEDANIWAKGVADAQYSGTNLRGAVWDGRQFTVVGSSGTVLLTEDGLTWTTPEAVPGTYAHFEKIAWTGTRLIAVGESGIIFHSEDGKAWTQVDSGVTTDLYDVAYAESQGERVFAVGEGGVILESTDDGLTWQPLESGTEATLNSIVPAGDRLLTCGSNSTVLESTDLGATWKLISTEEVQLQLYSGVWTGDETVFAGTDGALCSNDNDGTWIERKSGTREPIHAIVQTDDGFLAVGDDGTMISSNGLDRWYNLNLANSTINDGSWTGEQYVIVGDLGTIYTSVDGREWEARDSGTDAILYGVTHGNGMTVAVGTVGSGGQSRDGIIITSLDGGATWEEQNAGVGNWLYGVEWTGRFFTAAGSKGALLHSVDGREWEQVTSPVSDRIYGLTSNPDGLVIAAGDSGVILSSVDGREWARQESGVGERLFDVTWTGNQFLAVGAYGQSILSKDGIYWTQAPWVENLEPQTSKETVRFFTAATSGTRLYLGGKSGYISHTDDAIKLSKRKWARAHIRKLISSDSGLVAVGSGGVLLVQHCQPLAGISYGHWANAHGLRGEDTRPGVSHNASGISNELAYVLGVDPFEGLSEGSPIQLPRIIQDDKGSQVVSWSQRSLIPPDYQMTIEASRDLKEWWPVASTQADSAYQEARQLWSVPDNEATLTFAGEGKGEHESAILQLEAPARASYFRLRVEEE
ncbi:MAG: hypothetical protein AAF514_04700 [Verrucomicrobiota bacterium]